MHVLIVIVKLVDERLSFADQPIFANNTVDKAFSGYYPIRGVVVILCIFFEAGHSHVNSTNCHRQQQKYSMNPIHFI